MRTRTSVVAAVLMALVVVVAVVPSTSAATGVKFDVDFHFKMMNYTWSSFCEPGAILNNTCYYCSDPDFKYDLFSRSLCDC